MAAEKCKASRRTKAVSGRDLVPYNTFCGCETTEVFPTGFVRRDFELCTLRNNNVTINGNAGIANNGALILMASSSITGNLTLGIGATTSGGGFPGNVGGLSPLAWTLRLHKIRSNRPEKRKRVFQEPTRSSNCSLAWDARLTF